MNYYFFVLFFSLPFFASAQAVDSVAIKTVDSLIQVSRTLTGQRDFEKALEVNSAAEKLALEKFGKESAAYGSCCFNQGRILHFNGDNIQAEKWYLESKDIREKTLGKEHPDYGWSLNNLAALYFEMGKYEKAETLWRQVMIIWRNALGREHQLYSVCLSNLGALYITMNQYEKAESLFLESIAIIDKKSIDYISVLDNLGVLYANIGNYEKAEPLFLESIAITEKKLGLENPDYAMILNNLANFYTEIGQYKKAESLYINAQSTLEKTVGKVNHDYAMLLNGQAILYTDMCQFGKAESACITAKSIFEKIYGKENILYHKSLNNLGRLYFNMNEYKKAELTYLESKAFLEKFIDKEHLEYAMILSNLASLYPYLKQYEQAEKLNLEAKAICEKQVGKEHPFYSLILSNMATLHWESGEYLKSETLYTELSFLNKKRIEKGVYYFSGPELNSYLNTISKSKDIILSFAQLSDVQKIILTCYDNSLFYKGFLLNATGQINRLAHTDSLSTEEFNRLKGYRRRLASQEALPLAERDSAMVAELEAQSNDLEKDLARTVAGYGEAMGQVKWEEVRSALMTDEVAIEFVRFKLWNKMVKTDSVLYAALVLRPTDKAPHYVYLCTEAQLKSVLDRWDESSVETSPADVYWQKEGNPSLYNLLWQPLESLLPKGTVVWYAPDGLLHRLNLAAISNDKNQPLAEGYSFHRVGSTRQLVVKEPLQPTGQEAALFGGLRYESDTLAIKQSLERQGIAYTLRSIDEKEPVSPENDSTALRDGSIDFLDNSLTEVQDISKSLKTAGFTPHAYTDFGGTEEAFLSLAGSKAKPSPRILHLATHGYFFPDPKADPTHQRSALDIDRPVPYRSSDNPLIRSGLLLSGCEQAWRTGKPASGRLADGILTAADIASMNLSNTELAVLSACQTGLGDVESNEGVYGLQRAFKIAGARYLIMSLWKVDDRVTMKLMTSFYAKWLDKKKPMNIPEAFSAAQKELRKEYPDPFFWAGFVLVE